MARRTLHPAPACSLLLLLVAIAFLPGFDRIDKDVLELEQGKAIERELGGEDRHFYRLTLTSGQHARVIIDQKAVDVAVEVLGPDGERLLELDARQGPLGQEQVTLVAENSGSYRVGVRAANRAGVSGRYGVWFEDVRMATAQDRNRSQAQGASAAGDQLRARGTRESLRSAIERYEEALVLFRAVSDRPAEARTLNEIGFAYFSLGDRQKALDYFDRALPLWRAAGDAQGQAETLNKMGIAFDSLGDHRKALNCFDQALPLWRATADPRGEAQTLNNIGFIHSSLGDKQKALDYYGQALPLRRSAGDSRGEAYSLNNIGLVHGSLGEQLKALDYFDQALPIFHALADPRGEAVTHNNIGAAHDFLGEKQGALNHYGQALLLSRAAADGRGEAYSLNNLGLVYRSLGDKQKALEHYGQALELSRALVDRRGEAQTLNNIGEVHFASGEQRKALEHFGEALPIFRALSDRQGEANELHNIGMVYDSLGDKRKAFDYLGQALPLFRAVGDRRSEAIALANSGDLDEATGEKQRTLDYYGQALALSRAVRDRSIEAEVLFRTARLERDQGNLLSARTQVENALAIIESLRTKVASQELRASYFASVQKHYELYIDVLMRLNQLHPSEALVATALQASERGRARSLLELLAEANIHEGIDETLKQREKATASRIAWIQSQLIRIHSQPSLDKSRLASLDKDLHKVESEREQLESEIRQKYPHYAELHYPTPLGFEPIQALLDDRTALLEYSLGSTGSFLFVISREGLQSFRLPPQGEIERLTHELQRGLSQPGRREFGTYVQAAWQLYQMLIAPAAQMLAKKKNLIIVADGVLHYLPFESLLTSEFVGGEGAEYRTLAYLLKKWAISYVPSASVLASLNRARLKRETHSSHVASKEFLGFADAVHGIETADRPLEAGAKGNPEMLALRSVFSEGGWNLPRLPDSSREITQIAGLYKPQDVSVYLQHDAKEENVKQNEHLRSARRIHFATHGLISEEQPQFSGLVLTLDDDPQEDGLLQVYEIFNIRLNADLVVLSACRTGLGRAVKGEGLIGLTRAFMYAGATSLVVSLWQVADRSTADLMVRFYQHLYHEADKSESLRRAKLDLLRSGRHAHPYYWASFILVGERKSGER